MTAPERLYDPKRPNELVLFDVDGTLLPNQPEELTGHVFWKMVDEGQLTEDMVRSQAIIDDSTTSHVYGNAAFRVTSIAELRDLKNQFNDQPGVERRQYLNPLVATFDAGIRGIKRGKLNAVADEIIAESSSRLYPEVLAELEWWRDEYQAYIGLISGSPDFAIQALRRHLNADIATGTQYRYSKGAVNQFRPSEGRGQNKDRTAESMLVDLSLRKLGKHVLQYTGHRPRLDDIPPEHRFEKLGGHGDTVSDLGLLEGSVFPVAVNPTPELRAIAISRSWQIIDTQQAA